MQRIASRYLSVPHHDFLGAFCRNRIDRINLVHDSKQGIERRLDGVTAVYRDVAVQNFLQYLGV